VEPVLAEVPRGAPVMLQAFDMPVLGEALERRPDLAGFFLVAGLRDSATGRHGPIPLAAVERARVVGVAGLAADREGITPELLEASAAAGLALYIWTYPDPESARRSAPAGAVWLEAELQKKSDRAARGPPTSARPDRASRQFVTSAPEPPSSPNSGGSGGASATNFYPLVL